jgi:hypothetical protein
MADLALKTYQVSTPDDRMTVVRASNATVIEGVLELWRGRGLVAAFGPGFWCSVTEVEANG